MQPPGHSSHNVLIVGAGELGRNLAASISTNHRFDQCVVGFLDDDTAVSGSVLGGFSDLSRIARSKFVDEVILAIPDQPKTARSLAQVAVRNKLSVTSASDLLGFHTETPGARVTVDASLLKLHQEPSADLNHAAKRGLDCLLSSIALVFLAPVMATIAVIIRSDSRGPALYRAPRVGRKGARFQCLKFRTMVEDADILKIHLRSVNEREGPLFKVARDPRITRVGSFLRRYSLDELPQLWNVLAGEMSLVGPRPHPLDDFERYREQDLRRLSVTPGITGLWQVTARRDPSFETNMALDVHYIENWSLWLDLQILCKTVFAVWNGSGA
jgi:exopolysaccharide biosynthesis polyprenyl glycosylphosphotransferase